MKVVTKSEAARMAGVSRQAIQDLKKINTANKKKYPFFVFDPDNGKPGVNVDHKDWIDYLNRNQSIRVKKNVPKKRLKSKVVEAIEKQPVKENNMDRLVAIVIEIMFEYLDFTENQFEELKKYIQQKYDDPNWKQKELEFVEEEEGL